MENATPPDSAPRRGRPRLTHCKNGHERTDTNIYTSPSGHRACRLCLKENSARFAARHQGEWTEARKARARERLFAENARLSAELAARDLAPTAEELAADARQAAREALYSSEGRYDVPTC